MKHTHFFIALDLKITLNIMSKKIFLGTLSIIFTKPKKFQSTKKLRQEKEKVKRKKENAIINQRTK